MSRVDPVKCLDYPEDKREILKSILAGATSKTKTKQRCTLQLQSMMIYILFGIYFWNSYYPITDSFFIW